ncbi:MAG: EamA family transporter, partial [Flavobacteriales bacterium]|nr:EamA family transporter [Flavobacteriales bacterium]
MATARQWLILILIAGIWGSSFILIKRGLYGPEGGELFTNLQVGSLRIIIAAIVMLPFVFKNTNLLKNGRLKFYLIVGLCGNALPAFLFATAQT